MPTTLAQSYRFCNALARRTAKNFYPAFWVLPSAQRRAMCALYAFMRVTDDLSDEPGQAEKKSVDIERWREQLG
ncbi:MAG TPA: squalene/phytoene synthase family protein, partial [Gemmataceae bacterium]|nr:squalene/phytoene synthase family protein [Gemmataceae bacterium]